MKPRALYVCLRRTGMFALVIFRFRFGNIFLFDAKIGQFI